jgi:hypothetical protein
MLPRVLIQTSKPAELEPLNGARWRMMVMPLAFNQFKRRAEYFTERSGIVTNDGQSKPCNGKDHGTCNAVTFSVTVGQCPLPLSYPTSRSLIYRNAHPYELLNMN